MDMTTLVPLSFIAGVLGIAFGIYQWKSSSDAKVDREGQFKGIVNTKLDTIINDAKENARQHQELYAYHNDHETRISVLEESKKSRRKQTEDN